jgi:hypothetical protein
MKQVIDKETAQGFLNDWMESLGYNLDEGDEKEKILSAIQEGRLDFDADKEEFSYTLRKPIVLENGQTVAQVKIYEPEALAVQTAGKLKNEMEMTIRLLSSITGQPLGVINRLKLRDMTLMGHLIGFFS